MSLLPNWLQRRKLGIAPGKLLKSDIGVGASHLFGNRVQVGVAIITDQDGRTAWTSRLAHPLSRDGLIGVMNELREVRRVMTDHWPQVERGIDWLDLSHNQEDSPPIQEATDG